MYLRHISLREFVELTSAELQMRPEEFQDDTFLRTAKLSLDRPAVRKQTATGQRGREVHRSLVDKAVALCQGLLSEPPIPDYPGRIALAALEELLRRGGGRWKQARAHTVLRFDQWSRSGAFDAAWVRSQVALVSRRSARGTTPLFSDEEGPVVGVFLGGPLSELRAVGESGAIDELHRRMEEELRKLEGDLGGMLRFRLFHPSFDVHGDDRQDLWEWDLGLLDEKVAVLIVAEIGRHAVGFGGACELQYFRRLPGEAAHLLSHECPSRSNYLPGYGREIGVETLPCADWHLIPGRIADFLKRRQLPILDAARRRDDAIVLAEASHRAIAERWGSLSRARQAAVRDDADVTDACMQRVLARASAFAGLSAYSQQRLVDGILGSEALHRPGAGRDEVDVDVLLQVGAANGWSANEMSMLAREGRRRISTVEAAATRLSYSEAESWRELYSEVFGV